MHVVALPRSLTSIAGGVCWGGGGGGGGSHASGHCAYGEETASVNILCPQQPKV